jgi:PAS domain S-box-containing protein
MSRSDPALNKGTARTRKGLERERFFLEAVMDAMLLSDNEGNILLANKAFSRLSGHKRRYMAGTPVSRYFVQGEQVGEFLREKPGQPTEREECFTLLDSASRSREIRMRLSPSVSDDGEVSGAFITIRDLSGQKQTEEQTAHLAAIVASSSDAIISQTADGNIRVWNHSAEKIFGYTAEEAVGRPFDLTVPGELVDEEQDVMDRIWRGEVVGRYETLRKRKDGRIINIAVAIAAIRDVNGNITGISKVEREITEQKKFEKELMAARRNAEREKQAAEDAMRAKQQFLASMSHEIRTPLNAIIGFTRLLLKSTLEEKQREYLNAIRISGDALMALVNDILDLAKVEAGKMIFEKVAFDPRAGIDSMLRLFETSIFKRKLELISAYDPAVPQVVLGDPSRLQQIMLNLVGNAVKFTPQGKITVGMKLLSETDNRTRISFSVTDTGIGIAESDLESIFEDFTQAGGSSARLYGGTGLGLAIVKQLVSALGGTVSVKSQPGSGSCFTVVLDFEKTTLLPEPKQDNYRANTENNETFQVLVVEDVALNQLFMKTLLQSFGYDAHIAGNGKVAIEKLRKQKYDLILMDLQMPEMNGYEATSYIRNEMNLDTPIIALTADVTTADVERCRDVGMNDYLPKPVDDKLLHSKLQRYAERRQDEARPHRDVADAVEAAQGRCTNLDYLKEHTYGDSERMKQLIQAYMEEAPRLINRMKQSINNMDWHALTETAHSLLPCFSIVGMNAEFAEMARKIKEHASRQEESLLINSLLTLLEDACIQSIRELEEEIANL